MENTFEVVYNDTSGKLMIEVKDDEKHNKKMLYFTNKTYGQYKKDYEQFMEEIKNLIVEFRLVFRSKKEAMYRLFYLASKTRPKKLFYNFVKFDFDYDIIPNNNYDIQQLVINYGEKKYNQTGVGSSFSLYVHLPDLKLSENKKYFDLKYSYLLKTDENKPIVDVKIKRIYISIDEIDRTHSITTLKHRYTLINSKMQIKDQLLQRVTSQIYSCFILNEKIAEAINKLKIKYVLFFDKIDYECKKKLFEQYKEIKCFLIVFKSLDLLGKQIDYFIKDKIDIIFIYRLEQLLHKNMTLEEKFDIQNFDYLYKLNPIELKYFE